MVDALITHEVIDVHDVEKIFGKRPWKSRADELMELAEQRRAQSLKGEEKAHQEQEEATTPPPFAPGEPAPETQE